MSVVTPNSLPCSDITAKSDNQLVGEIASVKDVKQYRMAQKTKCKEHLARYPCTTRSTMNSTTNCVPVTRKQAVLSQLVQEIHQYKVIHA